MNETDITFVLNEIGRKAVLGDTNNILMLNSILASLKEIILIAIENKDIKKLEYNYYNFLKKHGILSANDYLGKTSNEKFTQLNIKDLIKEK